VWKNDLPMSKFPKMQVIANLENQRFKKHPVHKRLPRESGRVSELFMSTLLLPDKMAASIAAPVTTASSASMAVFTSLPSKCS
jgi:hypothetical protein